MGASLTELSDRGARTEVIGYRRSPFNPHRALESSERTDDMKEAPRHVGIYSTGSRRHGRQRP